MSQVKILIDFCVEILSIPINFYGTSYTLMQWMLFGVFGGLVLWIVFRLFR